MIGALLGTQQNRDVSIVNSFELLLLPSDSAVDSSGIVNTQGGEGSGVSDAAQGGGGGDVEMRQEGLKSQGRYILDTTFFEARKEQCTSIGLPR